MSLEARIYTSQKVYRQTKCVTCKLSNTIYCSLQFLCYVHYMVLFACSTTICGFVKLVVH